MQTDSRSRLIDEVEDKVISLDQHTLLRSDGRNRKKIQYRTKVFKSDEEIET